MQIKTFLSSMANGSMDKVATLGQGSRTPSNGGGGHAPSRLMTGLQASAMIPKPRLSRTFYSNINVVLMVFSFATSHIRMTSAQANFSIQGTAYNCQTNIICIGDAHVYSGNSSNSSNGIQDGRLSLLPEASYYQAVNQRGLAYYASPVKLVDIATQQSASFISSFTIEQTAGVYNGSLILGDGMAFVISASNSGSNASLGTADAGAYFGFFDADGGTTFKSIVVEFDTYWNDYSPMYDISASHVSFDFMNITTPAAANTSDVDVNLGDINTTMYVWVEYNNETKLLGVSVSYQNSKPMSSLLNYTVDLLDVSEEDMWVGFSSASGSSYSNFYIGDWTFESYGIDLSSSPGVPPSSPGPATPTTPIPIVVGKSGGSKVGIIAGISVGASVFFLSACILATLFLRRRSRGASMTDDAIMELEGMPERFSYKQLSVATRAFTEESKLGEGGFGSVYRGVLPSSGTPVAVKKISGDSTQGEKEFIAEVSIVSQLRHRNLIQLQGWCKDTSRGSKYLLVYELMPNGSLDKVLFGSETDCLPWPQRFNILTGTAAAVEYLHQGWKQQVIHRDIKSSNIMLDAEWNAKLGDFGLARLVDHQREAATTMMAGTYGYIAPEVAASGRFTDKTDVFAFGAVVLEVACGRKALSGRVPEDEMILVDWVWRRLSEGDLMSTVDKRLGDDYDPHWMEVVLTIGLLCSHPNPMERPSMRHVVEVLSGDVPVPSIPTSKPAPVDSKKFLHNLGGNSKSRSGSISLPYTDKVDSSHVVELLSGDGPVPSIPTSKRAPVDSQKFLQSSGGNSKFRSGPISLPYTDEVDSSRGITMKSFGTSSSEV